MSKSNKKWAFKNAPTKLDETKCLLYKLIETHLSDNPISGIKLGPNSITHFENNSYQITFTLKPQ